MTLRAVTVMVDCADPQGLARWYVDVMGGKVVNDVGTYVFAKLPALPINLGFQQVLEPTAGKNSVHLDFAVADRGAEVERLLARGATKVGESSLGTFEWTVLADPEGNEFCIAEPPPS